MASEGLPLSAVERQVVP